MLRSWDARGWLPKTTEAIRRGYRELVRRRSRVRVVGVQEDDGGEPPFFILGAYRTGSTLLRYALDSHSRLCIPPETNILEPLARLANDEDMRAGLAGLGFERPQTLAELRRTAARFYGSYAASWNKPRWGDKSPAYATLGPFLAELFPRARFVLLFRHGLDQAHSFSRGGSFVRPVFEDFRHDGEDLRVTAARYWDHVTGSQLRFEADYPDRCARLRYEDLCAEPESSLRQILAFLGESWEPGVMRYHEFDHDVGHEDGRAVALQGFHFSGDHYRSWPSSVVECAVGVCSDSLGALGYAS